MKNKDRLYIALYLGIQPNGSVSYDTAPIPAARKDYKWALLISPKVETINTEASRWLQIQTPLTTTPSSPSQKTWKVETNNVHLRPHDAIIARVLIAKITDRNRLNGILLVSKISSTTNASGSTEEEEPRTHMTWIRDVVKGLREDGRCCKHLPEWQWIEQTCVEYADKSNYDRGQFPTLDMISGSSGEAESRQPVKYRT